MSIKDKQKLEVKFEGENGLFLSKMRDEVLIKIKDLEIEEEVYEKIEKVLKETKKRKAHSSYSVDG